MVLWTYINQPNAEGKVINRDMISYQLPKFIKIENKVILDFLLLHRRGNEYLLRKSIGPSFNHKFESVLNRLMNVGVVKRLPDGKLEINEYIVNEIATLLTKSSKSNIYKSYGII
ncbi:MAG: hypothetical protein IPL23_24025 [Saprospiraceae bacterium]|nr:hypothetical protein [Saprospiraceae bacterium]